jgi:CBS domain-containing protein
MKFTASSIMRSKLVACDSTDNLKKVANKMLIEKVGSVLVKKEGEFIGIITDRDILNAVVKGMDYEENQAEEIMSTPLEFCDADDSLEKCKELFEKTNHSRLVVRKDDKIVGVLLEKFVDRFLGVSKMVSLSRLSDTPKFRTGRG